ncbi:protein cordon-bleu-like [Hippocampus comes]|uniref:protein cordon-bleu-like n=1 Tax=Hippocampus comes TaxID=109280 RepID=UPI00094EA8B2|nr:PREDICTED: protein cordon-bleu-like [Hippocampus comes]
MCNGGITRNLRGRQQRTREDDKSTCCQMEEKHIPTIISTDSGDGLKVVESFFQDNHLNLTDFTEEYLTPNVLTDALKPGGMENKIKRPYVPEATVRLLINYNKSQKTVLRVNPQLPLELLLPLVCDKCDLRLETTVLLRDRQSKESLDIAKTLNEHGLREVFAQDTADKNPLLNRYQACTHEVGKPEETSKECIRDTSLGLFVADFIWLDRNDDIELKRIEHKAGVFVTDKYHSWS